MTEYTPPDDYDNRVTQSLHDDIADQVAHTGRFAHDDEAPGPAASRADGGES